MKNRRNRLQWIFALAVAAAVAIAAGCGGDDGAPPAAGPTTGVVAFSNGWIGVVFSDNQSVSAPRLVGQLGAPSDALLDVAVTPDGKTALATSFGSDNVFIFDLSDPAAPGAPDNVTLSFFPEDVDLTPDGRFAIVTDGGFSPKIAVIDVANRTLVEEYPPTPVEADYVPMYQAVAVAADGRTVLTIDYGGRKVNTLTLDSAGHLTYVGAIDISPDNTLNPVNIAISPNGRTAIVAVTSSGDNTDATVANMGFPVLRITAPGQVELVGLARSAARIIAAQSVAFHPNGGKAYVSCVREMPEPAIDNTDDPAYPRNAVVVLNVTGPGVVADSGSAWPVEFIGRSQLFGVDTLAVDPLGRNLYVGNMTMSGGKSHTQVLDLSTGSVAKTIAYDNVTMPSDNSVQISIPVGVAFPRY